MFVQKLAEEYEAMVAPPGIPWAALELQGHGITVNGYDPKYMDTMMAAGAEFYQLLGTLDIEADYRTMRAKEGRTAITQLYTALSNVGGDVWDALKQGNFAEVFHFSKPVYVASVATVAAYASNGAYLHYDGVMEDAIRTGFFKPEQVQKHAQTITQIFQSFVAIDKEGGFSEIKRVKPAPSAGLGIAFLVGLPAWAIVTLGVVVTAGLCYIVYKLFQASPEQDQVAAWCDKLIEKGGDVQAQYCIKAMDDMHNAKLAGLWKPVNTVAILLGVGLVVYFGSMALPNIVRGVKEARAG